VQIRESRPLDRQIIQHAAIMRNSGHPGRVCQIIIVNCSARKASSLPQSCRALHSRFVRPYEVDRPAVGDLGHASPTWRMTLRLSQKTLGLGWSVQTSRSRMRYQTLDIRPFECSSTRPLSVLVRPLPDARCTSSQCPTSPQASRIVFVSV